MFHRTLATGMLAVGLVTATAGADIVWHADFSNYSQPGETIALDTSFPAASGTLGFIWQGQTAEAAFVTAGSASPDGAMAGLLTNLSGAGTLRVARHQLAPSGATKAGIPDGAYAAISFDIRDFDTDAADHNNAFVYVAKGNSSAATDSVGAFMNTTVQVPDISLQALTRATIVINRTGSAINLPGALGVVPDEHAAFYYTQDGVTFILTKAPQALTDTPDGFFIQANVKTIGGVSGLLLDNFLMSDAPVESQFEVDGVRYDFRSLPPGTQLKHMIPEPTAGMMMGVGLVLLAGRFARREAR